MMKVLLIQPSETDRAMIHLGLGYLAAALEKRGDTVKVLDVGVAGGSERNLLQNIESYNPEVVGITAQTASYSKALRISRLVKKWNHTCPVIFGGPHASILTEEVLKEPTVDIVVRGEGDATIVELMNCLEAGDPLAGVRGISFKQNGGIYHNETQPFVENMDALPFPAWHLFDMDRYLARMKGRKVAPVLSSRGCPFGCIFCYRGPAAGKTFRARSPEKIIEEIRLLQGRYGIGDILFVDDIFTLNQKRAERICDLIIESGLDISWRCQTRADCLNLDLLHKMKASNCIDISMGIESGNTQILAATGKKITKEKIREAFRLIKEVGISTSSSFIIGLPGDTVETVKETIEFAKELNSNYAIFYAAIPYPGTELARQVVESGGKLPDSWDDYRLMSSDRASSKMLADLKISNLAEKELRHLLKTAQFEFQIGRFLAGGEARGTGIKNMMQIIRLTFARSRSSRDLVNYIAKVLSAGFLFVWGKITRP
jgi:radical SAM superfamily enzyme YgiQ (UPF0313 family)